MSASAVDQQQPPQTHQQHQQQQQQQLAGEASIESKLEKLNLKLLQNKLFQSNRTYFIRMSAYLSTYSGRAFSAAPLTANEIRSEIKSTDQSETITPTTTTTTTTTTINSSSSCSSISNSSSSSSSSGNGVEGKKTKKAVRFADTLGFQLVTIWCMNHQSQPVKLRRLTSEEDSEDSSGSSSFDDEDTPSSNDEDELNGIFYFTFLHNYWYNMLINVLKNNMNIKIYARNALLIYIFTRCSLLYECFTVFNQSDEILCPNFRFSL